jgi:hypothetical protein
MTNIPLPRGIRNMNPGNLRRGVCVELPWTTVNGFAKFQHFADGLASLAKLCITYVDTLKKQTVFDFVMTYAPPSENDSIVYVTTLARWVKCPPDAERVWRLRVDTDWQLLDLMRGIIHIENGQPPSGHSMGGEWFSPYELWNAITRARAL